MTLCTSCGSIPDACICNEKALLPNYGKELKAIHRPIEVPWWGKRPSEFQLVNPWTGEPITKPVKL